jgi:multicomponent Na+:H+ antiporter subunit D
MAVRVGSWPAPFAITLVADLLSAMMVVLTALVGAAVVTYSEADVASEEKASAYYPLVMVLLTGVCGAFLTGDLFNLFVWFEVMLISSFVLLALGGKRQQLEGAIKYVTLNLIASALFLAGVGLLYGLTGTLNLADLHVRLGAMPSSNVLDAIAMLLLVAFGLKAAVFPLFFWLPASYHTAPVAVSALFAGLLTKVGVYALLRVFTLVFVHRPVFAHELILVVAGLTMVTGVLGAAAQVEVRRILSFHIVSQIGYMIMGLGLADALGLAGSIFYVAHHIIVKTNLFLVSGLMQRSGAGSGQLAALGGLWRERPGLSLLFLIPALSLAGIPPLSGFFAKLVLVQAGLQQGRYVIVVVALLVGLLTLFSMTKIWGEAFWAPSPKPLRAGPLPRVLLAPCLGLAALTLLISVHPAGLLSFASRAAEQLLDPSAYVSVVLGGLP